MFKKLIIIILALTFSTFNICIFAEPLLNDSSCNYFKPERSTICEPNSNNSFAGKFNMQNNRPPITIYQQSYILNHKHPETIKTQFHLIDIPEETNDSVEIIEFEKDYNSIFNQYYGYMKTLNHLV